jgi:serine phosphatase RsbU (regulator of sigma subunit)
MKKLIIFIFLLSAFQSLFAQSREIDSLEHLVVQLKDRDRILQEQAALVVSYFTAGEQKKSLGLYNDAITRARSSGSQSGLGALYHARGTLFYYQAIYDSALIYYERAAAIRKKINDVTGLLKSVSNIGSIHFMLTDYKKALEYYEDVLRQEEKNNLEEGSHLSINNLGYVYSALRMPAKAIRYFRKAEKVYGVAGHESQLIYTYDGLSTVYKDLKKTDTALYYEKKCLDLAVKLGDQTSVSYAWLNIGIIEYIQRKFNQSKKTTYKAIELGRALNDKRLEMSALANLAANELELGQSDSVAIHIDHVMKLQNEVGIKVNSEELSQLYSVYYYQKGDFRKAYDQLLAYDKRKDSLYNINVNSQLTELQEKYESEKKEKQNQLLQSQNRVFRTTRNYLAVLLLMAILIVVAGIFAYRKIRNTNKALSVQKSIVEEKQKEILDSINYAKRIQFALLASEKLLSDHLPEHFVFFRPKSVVSGDFYWGTPIDDGFMYITADCTGHGVPGAFMSLLNMSKLNHVINEKKITRPDLVLNELRTEIISALNPKGSGESKDGMDAVLCRIFLREKRLDYAAANNSFYIVRDKKLLICKADKMPVGKSHDDATLFSYNQIQLQEGDVVYTFTDGFADQFGGPLGKKYKYKQMEELFLEIHQLPMQRQNEEIAKSFSHWKGLLEQVDDVCIIGLRIT